MASARELKSVIKESLESRGVLGQIKARIRAEVYNALDDTTETRPPLSNTNMIINELIREYLEFNKYRYTSSVLQSESGMAVTPLDREFLTNELNVVEDSSTAQFPLLYSIVSNHLNSKKAGFSIDAPSRRRDKSPARTSKAGDAYTVYASQR